MCKFKRPIAMMRSETYHNPSGYGLCTNGKTYHANDESDKRPIMVV